MKRPGLLVNLPLLALVASAGCASSSGSGRTSSPPRSTAPAPAAPESSRETLSIVDASPPRGSMLSAGDEVDFRVTLHYNLVMAPEAELSLVVNDDGGPRLDAAPTRVVVRRGAGEVTLEARVAIRRGARRLDLMFLLSPGTQGTPVMGTTSRVSDSISYDVR